MMAMKTTTLLSFRTKGEQYLHALHATSLISPAQPLDVGCFLAVEARTAVVESLIRLHQPHHGEARVSPGL